MKHKKAKHTNNLPCRDFPNCRRSAEQCWYKHESTEQLRPNNPNAPTPNAPSNQGFRQGSPPQHPPDQMAPVMEMLKSLQQQMNSMKSEIQTLKK